MQSRERWGVLGTLFFATFLNYFDRQTLATAIEPIAGEFGLSDPQRAELLAAFTLTYALSHLFVGAIIDRLNYIRWFFGCVVLGWSLSTLLVGFAENYQHLLILRYLLGVWESVNFPICLMIISRIFPPQERTLASGIFASGAFLATLSAPPVVIFLTNRYDWRYAFIIAGLLGFVWLAMWLIIYKDRNINPGQAGRANQLTEALTAYALILRKGGFWGVALMGLGVVPSLYFASQWFPTYLVKVLGQPFDQTLSMRLSIIYFMQDIGLWLGGVLVLWLAKLGASTLNSRKIVMTLAFALMMSILFVSQDEIIDNTVVLLAVYVTGIGIFLGNQHAFKQDVLPGSVGSVAALVGFIETGFTFFVLRKIGAMTVDNANFTIVFMLLAGLATFSLLVVFVFMRPKYLILK